MLMLTRHRQALTEQLKLKPSLGFYTMPEPVQQTKSRQSVRKRNLKQIEKKYFSEPTTPPFKVTVRRRH